MEWKIDEIIEGMPDFTSHEEALDWFTNQYKDRFLLRTSDIIEGTRVYFYHFVKDFEVYEQYMDSLANNEEIISATPFHSYSTIEISEDGQISITI
ncbi:hypothetical protein [Bacillus sp. T33-2]|uniref:hypothetical protein n=1 Tax=Bacillus sp. T33-2 TaxID=2054168 RepID=UPI000C7762BC|nr:hypothetical protein [Bacillus sp. T33-2]PLR95262.1 hypothetical protein CVD19_14910 [Bacillus sp. T33-2]